MKLKPQFRNMEIGKVEDKTVTLSFSSEAPYERYWGNEILDHGNGAMDMTRLERNAPLLFNHDPDKVIGAVEKAWIENGKGMAKVRFGESKRAKEVLKDVEAGVLKNVSVGYQILEMVEEGKRNGLETYRVTKWQPLEVSIVSIPADTTVGIGRGLDAETEVKIQNKKEAIKMPEEVKTSKEDLTKVREEARKEERKRVSEIRAIGEKVGNEELARQFIDNGKSVDAFREAILEQFNPQPKVDTKSSEEVGMSDKEVRQYSIVRAINAMLNPTSRRAQEAAKFEFEVSEEAQSKFGVEARGVMVPFDVLKRNMVAGSVPGANVVSTDLMAGDFIELLRNRSAVINRASIMAGLNGNVAIPRQTSASTIQDLSETGAITASDLGLDQVTLSPKRTGGEVNYSKQLLAQSSIDVENLIRNDLIKEIALRIDYNAINGSGTANAPTGILNTTGVGLVSLGTNGAAPTWADIVALESKVEAANAGDEGAAAYIVNAKTNGYFKTTPKEPGYPTYMVDKGQMNGYQVAVSNQMPSNLTKGTGTNLSAIAFGNFSDLMIGFWGGIDLIVDPYTQKETGLVSVLADQFYDVAVRHPESFAVIKDAAV